MKNTDFVMPIFRALFRLQATNLFPKRPISVSRTETFVLFGARIEAVLFFD